MVSHFRGMAPDAVDEDEDEEEADGVIMDGAVRRKVDPDASYRNDPKKALRNYLQNKGYSCDFEVEESGPGHAKEYTARIRLPIETSMGPVYGQATAGKKRDAEREAALDACIQLDSRGMFGSKSSGQKSGEGNTRSLTRVLFVSHTHTGGQSSNSSSLLPRQCVRSCAGEEQIRSVGR